MRIRIRYSVNGKIRFISHLDLMRAFFRACIRKDIPVEVTQGFSPHLKISFGPPLNLGMTSSDEYLDMYTTGPVDKIKLQEGLPEGIIIEDIYEVPKAPPSLCANLNRAVYSVRPQNSEEFMIDMPIGNPVNMLAGIYPELSPDELRLWRIHREKLYNERDFN